MIFFTTETPRYQRSTSLCIFAVNLQTRKCPASFYPHPKESEERPPGGMATDTDGRAGA